MRVAAKRRGNRGMEAGNAGKSIGNPDCLRVWLITGEPHGPVSRAPLSGCLLMLTASWRLSSWRTVRFAGAQTAPPSPLPPQARTAASQPHAGQAYSLPPDKLAKAMALNQIRLMLDIAGSLWGLAFCGCCWRRAPRLAWTLGAAHGVAALDSGAALLRSSSSSITAVAGLPLDMIGHMSAAITASACRAGEAGSATRARRWEFRCCRRARCCCCSTGLCAAGRAATGLASGW